MPSKPSRSPQEHHGGYTWHYATVEQDGTVRRAFFCPKSLMAWDHVLEAMITGDPEPELVRHFWIRFLPRMEV